MALFTLLTLAGLLAIVLHFFKPRPTSHLHCAPRKSLLQGYGSILRYAPEDGVALLESWYSKYGSVFEVPVAAGMKQVTLCDPKAISYVFSRDGTGFVRSNGFRKVIEGIVGRGLIWAEGEAHRRQRRAMAPAFSNASLREMTPIVFDTVHKLKNGWDEIIDGNQKDEALLDIQKWMNNFTLDTIGSAGFGYDFGAMQGRRSAVTDMLDIFNAKQPEGIHKFIHLANAFLPLLTGLPIGRRKLFMKLSDVMKEILSRIFEESKREEGIVGKERAGGEAKYGEKSALGVLVKAQVTNSDLWMSEEEIMSQMKSLLIGGYDAPAGLLTWSIIELCRNPDMQNKLRQEFMSHKGRDPTWDQLSSGFPYLDAFVNEALRMHPSLSEIARVTAQDEWIPLSSPIINALGQETSSIFVPKGSHIALPALFINTSRQFWGDDAKVFNPGRWIDDKVVDNLRAKEIQGYKHTMSFGEGPRICIGRGLALIMVKALLFVLLRNYSLELRDGRKTKIERHWSLLPRPKVAGEEGCQVPIIVRRLE